MPAHCAAPEQDKDEIECARCDEVVPADMLDYYGRCDHCQEKEHQRQERPY